MSDYLQRLVSRHFGQAAAVMPSANRYFSRGAELAADPAPDAVVDAPPTLAAESPARDAPAANPASEDAEHRRPARPPVPAAPMGEPPWVRQPPPADTETGDAMPARTPLPRHTPRATERAERGLPGRGLPEAPASPSRRAPQARHDTKALRTMRAADADSSARQGDALRSSSAGPFAALPSNTIRAPRVAAAPEESAAAPRIESSVRTAKGSASPHAGVTQPQPAVFAPGDAAATLVGETALVRSGEAAPTQRASRPPAVPNRGALQARRAEAAAIDRRGSPPRHRAATATVDATDVRASPPHDPAPWALPSGSFAPALESPAPARGDESPLPVFAGAGLGPVVTEPVQPLSAAGASAPAAPEVTVTIGSVELHAAAPVAAPPPAVFPERRGPRLSLDEYLQRRSRGRR